jgi:hypothetical protein
LSASAEPETLTFVHIFSRELRCTLSVANQAPEAGMLRLRMEWTGRPKKKNVPEYRQWILGVNQSLVERWGRTLLYALGVAPDRTEFWTFEPGKAPKLARVVNAGIP